LQLSLLVAELLVKAPVGFAKKKEALLEVGNLALEPLNLLPQTI
jgi:hypothetical protein